MMIDLAGHALYVAVKQHDIRPPMSKLTSLYPRNLLVLVMEMWETDPSLVKKTPPYIYIFILFSNTFYNIYSDLQ